MLEQSKKTMMKKYFFYAACALLSWTACNRMQPETASLPISEDKLVAVLVDVQMAEAIPDGEMRELRDSLVQTYYPQIFAQHQISASDFDSTMSRLGRQPKRLEQVYKKVAEQLLKK
jgi:hypothetical protein